MTTYAINDGHGNSITQGVQEHEVWRMAKRIATERGEAVYVAEMRLPGHSEDWEPPSEKAVEPE